MSGTSESCRRSQVMLGDLPANFLRVDNVQTPQQQQIQQDAQAAQALQYQMAMGGFAATVPRLSVTVIQAKLTKNYGIVKMDPYVRIRVAHQILESHTSHGGGKNPHWNKVFHCYIPQGADTIYFEIYDENAFTTDDKVAWTHIQIPEKVFNGYTVDEWFPLNGRQGDSREGMVQIVMTYNKNPPPMGPMPVVYSTTQPIMMGGAGMPVYYPQQQVYTTQQPVMMGGSGMPVYNPQQQQVAQHVRQQQVQQVPQGPAFTDEDVKQVKDMFPNIDQEVIRSVLEANGGNKDATINNLLSMESS